MCLNSLLCMWMSRCSSTTCWKNHLLSIELPLLFCQRLVDCIYEGLLWGSTFCFISFPGGSFVKNPPAMQGMWVQPLGWEDSPEKDMATHSSNLAWEIPWRAIVHGVPENWTFCFIVVFVCSFASTTPSWLLWYFIKVR